MSFVKPKTVSIIIPVFNERTTIKKIIEKVKKAQSLGLGKEIIVVNDGSTDGTGQILQQLKDSSITVLHHPKNQGKGAAIRTGLKAARGDIILIQDADLEYHPEDYPTIFKPFLAQNALVVYGSRELSGKNRHSSALFHLGGHLVTGITNLLYGSKLTDEPTCYKAFRKEVIMPLPLRCQRFEFCPEVTALLLKKGVPIIEVPIRYTARSPKAGKKINARDGIEAIWTLLRYRINL